jgi:hypothetical protein
MIMVRARNDLPWTDMSPFIPNYDLSTIIRHFTTHTNRLFDHTRYLNDFIQSLDCIKSYALFRKKILSAPCMILARPYMTGWVHIVINSIKQIDYNTSFPSHIESSLRLHISQVTYIQPLADPSIPLFRSIDKSGLNRYVPASII